MQSKTGEILNEPVEWVDRTYIRDKADPVYPVGGLISLRGNLAPDGAILKRAAATPELLESESRAVVLSVPAAVRHSSAVS